MTAQDDYTLRYRTTTPEEDEKRCKDPKWYAVHTFGRGWGWCRGDGAHVMRSDSPDFEHLSESAKEQVWRTVKAANEKRIKQLQANPMRVEFTEIAMPVIKKAFPKAEPAGKPGSEPIQKEDI